MQRTGQFINALLSKDDIKSQDKAEIPDQAKNHVNGNPASSFQSNGGRPRFSDPPAPPPSQPLPEKPDVPGLKRGHTERPSSVPPSTTSPIRQENSLSQIIQLTEALNSAKREIDSHSARVRDLEEMLMKERQARMFAETMVQKMEENTQVQTNGTVLSPAAGNASELDNAFDPPAERPLTPEPGVLPEDKEESSPPSPEKVEAPAVAFQARIDSMIAEMQDLRGQLDAYRQRAEKAETERDASRGRLEEMVRQIQKRDEEERIREAERKSRPRSSGRSRRSRSRVASPEKPQSAANGSVPDEHGQLGHAREEAGEEEEPSLSRTNTITPSTSPPTAQAQDQALIQTLPYASMIGVVLLGMGLMAYLNGWQPQTKLNG